MDSSKDNQKITNNKLLPAVLLSLFTYSYYSTLYNIMGTLEHTFLLTEKTFLFLKKEKGFYLSLVERQTDQCKRQCSSRDGITPE
jgi:hypothetical protein